MISQGGNSGSIGTNKDTFKPHGGSTIRLHVGY